MKNVPTLQRVVMCCFFSSDYIQGLGGYDLSPANMKWAAAHGDPAFSLACLSIAAAMILTHKFQMTAINCCFASNRLESIGGYDVYVVYFKEQITDQFAYTEDLPMFQMMLRQVKKYYPQWVAVRSSRWVKEFCHCSIVLYQWWGCYLPTTR